MKAINIKIIENLIKQIYIQADSLESQGQTLVSKGKSMQMQAETLREIAFDLQDNVREESKS